MNALELIGKLLEDRRIPELAAVQPPNERILAVREQAIAKIDELIMAAKLVHSKRNPTGKANAQALHYFFPQCC